MNKSGESYALVMNKSSAATHKISIKTAATALFIYKAKILPKMINANI